MNMKYPEKFIQAIGLAYSTRIGIYLTAIATVIALILPAHAQNERQVELEKLPAHPRILLLKGEEQIIQSTVLKSETWAKMHRAIVDEATKMIDLPVLERIQVGSRLLAKSRECIRRVFY